MTDDRRPEAQGSRLASLRAVPADLIVIRLFALALGFVLAGYMFMGRGFAHIGIGPVYVGDLVLALGVLTALFVLVRRGIHRPAGWTIGGWTIALLVLFMLLGAARTIPYLGTFGLDALRDGVLWGYAAFALIVYLITDRALIGPAIRAYGWLVPVFALWLPICWSIFVGSQAGIDPTMPGSNHPLVFFKAGDMAVHSAAAIAFIVLAPNVIPILRPFASRLVVSLPLTWTVLLVGAASRGALLGAATGLGVTALATRRPANWVPVATATVIVLIWLNAATIIALLPAPTPSPTPSASPTESASPSPSAAPTRTPAPTATAKPGRDTSAGQLLDNIVSIFGPSSEAQLDGTRAFRLAWWSKIADYTVFGPYFWTGKGFGVNLADDDGFQPTADHSLRAPHNSHMSVLARMGVPGFVLWTLIQATFGIGLLRAVLAHHRAADRRMAGVGAWIGVAWTAMMVITSFDPYLEGPQGGIWFWTVFGLGLVVMRLAPRPATR